MRTKKSRSMLVAAAAAALLVLAGCGGSSGGSDSNSASANGSGAAAADTVAVDVGDGKTVDLSTGTLKVGLFMPGVVNVYGDVQVAAVQKAAEDLGWDFTLFDAGFDSSRQLTQLQTALESGGFDAVILQSINGPAVCKLVTEDYPEADVLVVALQAATCDKGTTQTGASFDEVWAPGTLNFVGSNATVGYVNGWLAAVGKANPGAQHVVVVAGPVDNVQTKVTEIAIQTFQEQHPDYTIDWIYTDYTASSAFNETQTYLQGHPDTTLLMSLYSPDISQGVIQAVDDAGLAGKVNIVDQGFGDLQIQQVESGSVQLSTLLFPANSGKLAVESIAAAQSGNAGPRFVDDSVVGTAAAPFVLTKDTISELPAELLPAASAPTSTSG